jgi:hypothetical protein
MFLALKNTIKYIYIYIYISSSTQCNTDKNMKFATAVNCPPL